MPSFLMKSRLRPRRLVAPDLLLYEVTNTVVQARRRGRISDEQVEDILSSFEGLGIALRPVTWQQMLPLALRFDRSAYYGLLGLGRDYRSTSGHWRLTDVQRRP
jgi:predicted nucleic acid-binding protein